MVHGADLQKRDGDVLVMATLFGLYPLLRRLYDDAGYHGAWAALKRVLRQAQIEMVRRSDTAQSFQSCPDAELSNAPSLGSTAASASP